MSIFLPTLRPRRAGWINFFEILHEWSLGLMILGHRGVFQNSTLKPRYSDKTIFGHFLGPLGHPGPAPYLSVGVEFWKTSRWPKIVSPRDYSCKISKKLIQPILLGRRVGRKIDICYILKTSVHTWTNGERAWINEVGEPLSCNCRIGRVLGSMTAY